MALKQICRYCGCTKYRISGSGFCEDHQWYEKQNNKPDYNRFSPSSDLYHCDRWRRERKEFLKENPSCVYCGEPATLIDHVIPHNGDETLFWEKSNWQPLCAACHKKKTWKEMRGRHTTLEKK